MIKLILTDIDGVWTDGGMYYDNLGNEFKKFNTYDGVGVKLAHDHNIKVGIITGEETKIVENRAKKLKVDFLYQNCQNKAEILKKIAKNFDLNLNEVAYIGDDINDIEIMKLTFSGCPCSAFDNDVLQYANYITNHKGGEGAFREFVEYIINNMI